LLARAATTLLIIAAIVMGLFVARRLWEFATTPASMDFVHFWFGGWFVDQGMAAFAYDRHMTVRGGVGPLGYPPPYLLLITPLAWVGIVPALFLWLAIGGFLFVAAAQRWLLAAIAFPPVAYNALVGQNGFLSGAAMLFGAGTVSRSPWLGGAALGLLSMKPQLALLLPVALVAGRHWRGLTAMTLCAVAIHLLAALAFGLEPYWRYLDNLALYRAQLQIGEWPWELLASAYAFARWFGAGHVPGLLVQAGCAAGATLAVWKAWKGDWPSKVPVLLAATLLVSPYLFTYDAVMLVGAVSVLAGTRPLAAGVVWLMTLPPFILAVGPYAGPNTIPLACLVCLVFFYRDRECSSYRVSSVTRDSADDRGSAPGRVRLSS
jgi:hypothetical protein